jgi:hypothetical protein
LDKLASSDVELDSLGVRHGKVAWIRFVSS